MPSKNDSTTRVQESTIIQLIRRGDRVQQIAAILGIRPSQVEAVLDRYVAREMAWRADSLMDSISTLEEDIVRRNLNILDGLASDMTTSLQRNIAAGHESEIDGLIYSVVRYASEYGISLPAYEKIAAALWQDPKREKLLQAASGTLITYAFAWGREKYMNHDLPGLKMEEPLMWSSQENSFISSSPAQSISSGHLQ